MDIGGITPIYVYRMWGGEISLEEIEKAFRKVELFTTSSASFLRPKPRAQHYCFFFAHSEKMNQKRGATPKAPFKGGCN